MFLWIAITAFWIAAVKVWGYLGPKVPLIFIAVWGLGFVAWWFLGLPQFIFMSLCAVLAVILLIVDRYQSAL